MLSDCCMVQVHYTKIAIPRYSGDGKVTKSDRNPVIHIHEKSQIQYSMLAQDVRTYLSYLALLIRLPNILGYILDTGYTSPL